MQKAFPIFVMELFCDGWLFLTHSDVTWDGSAHAVKRVRINADKSEWLLSHAREHFTDVPSNIDLCQYVGTTLAELEKHTELVVPRDDVLPRLQLLFEGDLTPITLVQLMCVGDWLTMRQGDEGEIRVAFDERLARQISGFGFLMRRFRAVLCSQSTMLSSSVIATVLEARPATEPGICAFLEMEDPVPVEAETEPAPAPLSTEQEKQRFLREVKSARDKMMELDHARNALLNQLLSLRRKYRDLSNQKSWKTMADMEEIGRQVEVLSGKVDMIDKQLSDARLAYAETRAASLQALRKLGQ